MNDMKPWWEKLLELAKLAWPFINDTARKAARDTGEAAERGVRSLEDAQKASEDRK